VFTWTLLCVLLWVLLGLALARGNGSVTLASVLWVG
jgi:hypothetical protein